MPLTALQKDVLAILAGNRSAESHFAGGIVLNAADDPAKLEEIQAHALDPIGLKTAWIQMSDEAEMKMIDVADEQPDMPIGVAFVDSRGCPGWIGDTPSLRLHAPSIRGCWPRVVGVDGW